MGVGLNIIRDILQNNYMNVGVNETAKNNILSKEEITVNSKTIIPALSDYFTIVNYWNSGTESDHKCNGACTGFCSKSCSNTAAEGSGCGNRNCSGGSDASYGSSHSSNCGKYCVSECSGCSGGCAGNCVNGCST